MSHVYLLTLEFNTNENKAREFFFKFKKFLDFNIFDFQEKDNKTYLFLNSNKKALLNEFILYYSNYYLKNNNEQIIKSLKNKINKLSLNKQIVDNILNMIDVHIKKMST